MTRVQAVRREFGEPFRDVVSGFAAMGYSRRLTAEILEINLSYFKQLIRHYAPNAPWKRQKDMIADCKPCGKGWIKGRPRNKPLKYSDEDLLNMIRKHPDLSYSQFSNLTETAASTVARRFGSWNKARRLALGP